MNGSLDTSVLVQLVTGQDPEAAKKSVKLVEQASKQLAVADEAIVELIFVLERIKKLPRQAIVSTIDTLSAFKQLNFNRNLFVRVLPMYASHPRLSIHDCCLAVYAELNGAEPLWTFDKALARQTSQAKLL